MANRVMPIVIVSCNRLLQVSWSDGDVAVGLHREGQRLADRLGIPFVAASAKTGEVVSSEVVTSEVVSSEVVSSEVVSSDL